MDSALWLTSTPANAGWCRGEGKRSKASRSSVRPLLALFRGKRSLDGEIVHIYSDGKPLFHDLMRRRSPQHFYAFDLLWLNGRDLRELPLIERKRLLRTLVCSPVLYADHIEAPRLGPVRCRLLAGSGRDRGKACVWPLRAGGDDVGEDQEPQLQPSGWSGGIFR